MRGIAMALIDELERAGVARRGPGGIRVADNSGISPSVKKHWGDVGKRMYSDMEKAFVDPKTGKLAAAPPIETPAQTASSAPPGAARMRAAPEGSVPTTTPPRPPGEVPGPKALIIHHTGGRGDHKGVIRTLNERGLGVQYIIDREGNLHTTGMPSRHMRPGQGKGAGLNNSNTVGVEIIGRDDTDILPVQVEAAKKLREQLGLKPEQVYGHGEVNTHKQATEGSTVVKAIRGEGGASPTATAYAPVNQPAAKAPAQKAIDQATSGRASATRGVDIPDRPGSSPKAPQQNAPASPAARPEPQQMDWFKRNAYLQKDRDTGTYLNPELARQAGATDLPPLAKAMSDAVKTTPPSVARGGAEVSPAARPRPVPAQAPGGPGIPAGLGDYLVKPGGQGWGDPPAPTVRDTFTRPASETTFTVAEKTGMPGAMSSGPPLYPPLSSPGDLSPTPMAGDKSRGLSIGLPNSGLINAPPQQTPTPFAAPPAQAASPVASFTPQPVNIPPPPWAQNWTGAGGGFGGGWGTGGFGMPWLQPFDTAGGWGGLGGMGGIGGVGFGGM